MPPALIRKADHSIGSDGRTLHESIKKALPITPAAFDRVRDIYTEVFSALQQAKANAGILVTRDTFARVIDVLNAHPRDPHWLAAVVGCGRELARVWKKATVLFLTPTLRN